MNLKKNTLFFFKKINDFKLHQVTLLKLEFVNKLQNYILKITYFIILVVN